MNGCITESKGVTAVVTELLWYSSPFFKQLSIYVTYLEPQAVLQLRCWCDSNVLIHLLFQS